MSVYLNNKNKGFTLVETIIALALVTMGVFMAMNFIDSQNKSRAVRTGQTIFRYIAIQVAHTATMAGAYYPPMTTTNNAKAVYVSCYDNKGESVKNINNISGYQVYFPSKFSENKPSDQCSNEASYEARFYWKNPSAGELRINIVHLASLKRKNNARASHSLNIFVK